MNPTGGSGEKKSIRVLLTGVGAPGTAGTIFMLEQGAKTDSIALEIFGVDQRERPATPAGVKFCGAVPGPESSDYIEVINKYVADNRIDLVVPQTTRENFYLASTPEGLNSALLAPSRDSIGVLNDKSQLLSAFHEAGIATTDYLLTHDKASLIDALAAFGYPHQEVVVKLPTSNGMRGTRKLTERSASAAEFLNHKPNNWSLSASELLAMLQTADNWPSLLVMPFYSGAEYSVDVLSLAGRRVIIPRRRDKMQAGISTVATISFEKEILADLNAFLDYHNFHGLMGFQFIMTDGRPRLLECNPRVQGTMVASMLTGVNILWLALKEKLQLEIYDDEYTLKATTGQFARLWGGCLTDANGKRTYI